MGASWASPQVAVFAGRTQVLTCADPWVIAYDPADGHELWKAEVLGGDVAPSPTVAGGLVVLAAVALNEGLSLALDRRTTG